MLGNCVHKAKTFLYLALSTSHMKNSYYG